MKIFCSKCGAPKEIEETALSAVVTCTGCGHRFSAGPPRVAASSTGGTVGVVLLSLLAIPVVIAIIGILAAIAIPNFIRFQARSKQSECKTNLKALIVASKSHFETTGQYTALLHELGFSPERGNRYAYFAGKGTLEDRTTATAVPNATDTQVGVDVFRFQGAEIRDTQLPPVLAEELGPSGVCPQCVFTAVCMGNIDNDPTLDVWSVSTIERKSTTGEVIPANVPFNEINDVSE